MTTKSDLIRLVPLNEGYLCFDLWTDPEQAKAVFTQRFGVEPETVIVGDMLRVGPAPEETEATR